MAQPTSWVNSKGLNCVEFIHNLGSVYCTCKSVRQSLELAKIWETRCARRGLILSGDNSGSVGVKQIDWQHVANSLLRRFKVLAEPFTPERLLSLAQCAHFVPRAIEGEASFIIQLREDPSPHLRNGVEDRVNRDYGHDLAIQFDDLKYRLEFVEERAFYDEEDVTLKAWLSWEHQEISWVPVVADVHVRIHCLFLDPNPQLTEVSSDGDAVFHIVSAPGTVSRNFIQEAEMELKMASHFGIAWSNNPASKPIFAFVQMHR